MISGLVVHLSIDASLAEAAALAMGDRAGLELGRQVHARLPLVVETTETASVEDTTDWLKNLPGVMHVDVAFVQIEE